MSRHGLCYVIPAYEARQTEHFYHLPSLLEIIGEAIPLAVVVERGEPPKTIRSARVVTAVGREGLGKVLRAIRFLRIARRLARLGYRTFFLRYSRMATTLLLLLRLRYPIRIFYWASGQADLGSDRLSARRRLMTMLRHWYFRRLVRHVDVVVTGPESMVGYMSSRWAIPTHKMGLLYNDIDTRRFIPASSAERARLRFEIGSSEAEFVVLFVHRLSERRGARLVAPVAETVAKALDGRLRMILVGDGPDAPYVQDQIRRSPCRDAFDVRGPLANRDLPALYQAADCFLMPSYEEGFPRVVLEAMATGVPVVATRAGGTQDVLGADYAYTADPGDVRALAAHLASFARDQALREDVGKQLRDRAERLYDTRVVADMLIDLVRRSP